MKFSLVTLYVSDLEPSLRFYRDILGMQVLRRMDIENDGTIVFLGEQDNVQLEIIVDPHGENPGYTGFSVGFDVEDMEAAIKKLESQGVLKLRGPIAAGGTTQLAFFKGPSGETVELISH